jgi:protein O-mannosyl-transferase
MTKRSKKRKAPPKPVQPEPTGAREILPPKPAAIPWKLFLQAMVIVVAALWIYWPALHGDWLWDDDQLVAHNLELRTLSGLGRIWFSAPATDYWPLTWSLLWVEWHIWGNQPLYYHLCSLALHIFSGLLIWRLFCRLGLRWGWLGGLLFVIHPLAVESVAWISEIKNTLSLPLFLLSLSAYIDYFEDNKDCAYLRSFFYYFAAMLCKTSVVMFPATLLLYCWWKQGRITWQDFKKTVPYFAIALIFGLVTLYFQTVNTPEDPVVDSRGFVIKLIEAGTTICFYLGKFCCQPDFYRFIHVGHLILRLLFNCLFFHCYWHSCTDCGFSENVGVATHSLVSVFFC